ncbi:MAG: ABC transporter substrate-binding protein [Verrucomicrobia bacterium]|nr:ABC transporter substrate-binding protein [Verrucomicrobiota bacterium]
MNKKRTTLLLNLHAYPFHAPIFVAKALNFYDDEGINLSILEVADPKDVIELVSAGNIDFGLKTMLNTAAAHANGLGVASIGTLLDEPPTGLYTLKSSGIRNLHDIVGKRIGYVGGFSKRIVDNLALLTEIDLNSYEMVRVGMNGIDAIRRNVIDAGIGFIHFLQVELEALCGEAHCIRLDQLSGLGCCCFCSIHYIAHERMIKQEPEKVGAFLRATQRGVAFTIDHPEEAFDLLCRAKPQLRSEMYQKIFERTLPFFSRTMLNIQSDWDKACRYTKFLNNLDSDLDIRKVYTNGFLPKMPHSAVEPIACCLG